MSLGITIDVNGHEIIKLYAQRVTNTGGQPNDDDVSEYLVTRVTKRLIKASEFYSVPTWDHDELGRITHRYGDGASVLAQKVLEYADNQQTQETT